MAFNLRNFNTNRKGNFEIIPDKQEIKDFINSDNQISENQQDNSKQIEKLFPSSHDIDIDLLELDRAPAEWNFFEIPDVETLKLIAKSIYYQGQLAPALVWKQPNGRYMILGGHTRFLVLNFLMESYPDESERFSKMRCHVYDYEQLNEATARFIIITNNMTQRAKESTQSQVQSIVQAIELQKEIKKDVWGELKGRSIDVVAKAFGFSVSKVGRIYQLRKLVPGMMKLLEDRIITEADARKFSAMTEDVQQYLLDNNTYQKLSILKMRNLLKAVTKEEAEDIVTAPEEYVYDGVQLKYEVPKNFSKLSLPMDKEDINAVKSALLKVLDGIEFKNEKSKEIMTALLKS